MAGYKYKGTEPWVPRTDGVIEKALPTPSTNKVLKPCGTEAAYQRHLVHNETPCTPCCDAHIARLAAYATKRPTRARPLAPCGTYAAWTRHNRNNEPIDEACHQAKRDYESERSRQRRANYQTKKAATNEHHAQGNRSRSSSHACERPEPHRL